MTPATLTESIPKTCRVKDVLRILQLARSTFYEQMKAGTFPVPEILPRIGRGPRFAGEQVELYRQNLHV